MSPNPPTAILRCMSTTSLMLDLAELELSEQRQRAGSRTNVHAVLLGFGGTVAALVLPNLQGGVSKAIMLVALSLLTLAFALALLLDRHFGPDRLGTALAAGGGSVEHAQGEVFVVVRAALLANRQVENRQDRLLGLAFLSFVVLVGTGLLLLA